MKSSENGPTYHKATVEVRLPLNAQMDIADSLANTLNELSIFATPSVRRTLIEGVPLTEKHAHTQQPIGRSVLRATFASLESGRHDTHLDAKGQGAVPDRHYRLSTTPERDTHDWHVVEGAGRAVVRSHSELLGHLQSRLDTNLVNPYLDTIEPNDEQTRDTLSRWLLATPDVSIEDSLVFSGESLHMPVDEADDAYATGAVLSTTKYGLLGGTSQTARISAPIIIPHLGMTAYDEEDFAKNYDSLAQETYHFKVEQANPQVAPRIRVTFELASTALSSGRLQELAFGKQYQGSEAVTILEHATNIVRHAKLPA